MTIDEIIKLVQAVSDNGLTSFEYEEGNARLVLKKKKEGRITLSAPIVPEPGVGSGGAAVVANEEVSRQSALDIGSDKVVTSPLVGTFYSSSSPDAEPFVKVGDTVRKGQVLGIIEAMKLMNEIESEYDGVVEAILVGNEDVVEFGQPLFRIH